MSKKTNDLEWRCQLIESKLSSLEDSIDVLKHVVEKYLKDFDREFDRRVDCMIEDKARIMVVDSLAAYKKGKANKKQVDYISEVLKGDD